MKNSFLLIKRVWNSIVGGVILRMLVGIAVTLFGYNPTGHSLYHWVAGAENKFDSGIILVVILWVSIHLILLAASWSSLGAGGTIIIASVLGAIAYFTIDHHLLSGANGLVWLSLILYAVFLGAGASAGIIWRRAFGVFITSEAGASSDATEGGDASH